MNDFASIYEIRQEKMIEIIHKVTIGNVEQATKSKPLLVDLLDFKGGITKKFGLKSQFFSTIRRFWVEFPVYSEKKIGTECKNTYFTFGLELITCQFVRVYMGSRKKLQQVCKTLRK